VSQTYDAVIVGCGIAGGALATVLARAGKAVLVLERSTVYQDRVRGEFYEPWGVAEARRLGLHGVLVDAGGIHHTRYVPYDETIEPAEAESAAVALDSVLPNVPGTLGLYHPSACQALSNAAKKAGAEVQRGVSAIEFEFGQSPVVRYRLANVEHAAKCRLVVGADGRESVVRKRAGIALQATEPLLWGAGLLVEDLWGWPEHQITIGTEADAVFFVLPQHAGRARLYLMYPVEQRRRIAGPTGAQAFLECFHLDCVPGSDHIARAKAAGPCASFPMNDSWTEGPVAEGLALIGDAAGYSDPHLGQGLSVALRDVRVLSDLLLDGKDWSAQALTPMSKNGASGCGGFDSVTR
jgi:2-polyprenyl-6-methoxyphenol hydroxylase-like FAD-dependent oxidoreductase